MMSSCKFIGEPLNKAENSENSVPNCEECSDDDEEFKAYLYDDEYSLDAGVTIDQLKQMIADVKKEINTLELELKDNSHSTTAIQGHEEDYEFEAFEVPPHCVPIRCDVRYFDWSKLYKETQFDVIVMDPPWQLASAAPTRGVALGYKQLPNSAIERLPIPQLQKNGFIFIWVINARYSFAIELMEKWGYEVVDDITWVKSTVNRRLAKGHGFYLQHAKETCLVGKKGDDPPGMQTNISSDVIFSERRGQSQKPEEMYELIEKLVPNGTAFMHLYVHSLTVFTLSNQRTLPLKVATLWTEQRRLLRPELFVGRYLEIFARRNNLRNYWVSIGIEL
jgi:mRNA (2'-O-methyladenosine-N6-)-methyltransferase